MASLQDIRRRIRSVQNTRKITRALELVAASKLRRAQQRIEDMGFYFVNSLFASDPYPVMAWLMVVATMVIIFNLIADILYGVFDPRIRYE